MGEENIKPGRWYYALAALVFVTGCILFGLFLGSKLRGLSSSLRQIVVPGVTEITLTEPGNYMIFYERRSIVDGHVYATGEHLSGLECQLVSRATGSGVALSAPGMSTSYSIGGRAGRSIFEFYIDRPGVYILSARYTGGLTQPQVVLAVGHEFGKRVLAITVGSVIVMFALIGIALAIVIATAIKRDKAKKELTSGIVSTS
jgi:hypothetical protein